MSNTEVYFKVDRVDPRTHKKVRTQVVERTRYLIWMRNKHVARWYPGTPVEVDGPSVVVSAEPVPPSAFDSMPGRPKPGRSVAMEVEVEEENFDLKLTATPKPSRLPASDFGEVERTITVPAKKRGRPKKSKR